ncbi:MAG: radical SAM protein [Acidimicrobiales bacterium]
MVAPVTFRWRLADPAPEPGVEPTGQLALFADESVARRRVGTGEYRGYEFLEVNAKRVVNSLPEGTRAPHRHTINAYRGCSHACVYCFARPTHEYLGLNAGEDFERKLVVKVNAVERVRAEVGSPTWSGQPIAMGTNTDPYQRCEGKYHLTRGIVEVLGDAGNPFSILTKSTLILRDLDVLARAAERAEVRCNLSIGTLDEAVWRATEPGTPHPRQRVAAVRRLTDAGIITGVLVAPIIPGLSDAEEQLAEVVDAVIGAGARAVIPVPLHLRPGVRQHFMTWLVGHHPELAVRYRRQYRGSYLPAEERDRLCGFVRDRVAAALR